MDETAVEVLNVDIGQHSPPHPNDLVTALHPHRSAADEHTVHPRVTLQLPTPTGVPVAHGSREPPGAAFGYRELTVCPSMHSISPSNPEPAASSGMSAWQAFPASSNRDGNLDRVFNAPRTGGKGLNSDSTRANADPQPLLVQGPPDRAVAGMVPVQQLGRDVDVTVQQGPRIVE